MVHPGWEGVRQSNFSAVCPQINAYDSDIIEGDEDCLYLNVFVPNIATKVYPEMLQKLLDGSFERITKLLF